MKRFIHFAALAIGTLLLSTQFAAAQSDVCVRMEQRLRELDNDFVTDEYELNLRRDRVEAALDANNCSASYEPDREVLPREAEPRRRPYEILGNEQPDDSEPVESTAPVYGGQYQTLCVRTCDGYYYPISYATGAENFGRDEAQCQAQCPGAKLFYHSTTGETVDQMISLRGQAYTDMPYAFKFRKVGANGTPQCTCQRTAGNYTTLGNQKEIAKPVPRVLAPPTVQPAAPGQSAEPTQPAATLAPAEPIKPVAPVTAEPLKPVEPAATTKPASPVETKVEPAQPVKPTETKAEPVPPPAPPVVEPEKKPSSIIQLGTPAIPKVEAEQPKPLSPDKPIDPNRKVRVVGPTFLPDQEGAINLRVPGQKPAQ
ncbi:DUF2865 domain-containing protein [Phyllobacterium myrsinacearum]|uniref:DUF2865 domain-containing protein n=1 Tax=Phyllobacterium myrsinacearum TaxID=28101 RepID=A0A839EPR8_9HYPH|nr:DUF2865 domain-containing protein [Phyllobacterium myrsinacearum]MBA8878477.1 hypothetical protein [Phyllobacterium myrsinacearum]